jgi:hypothetical protein
MIRRVTFYDQEFQCGLRTGLWTYATDFPFHQHVHLTFEGKDAGFVGDHEFSFGDLDHDDYSFTAKLQAQYVDKVTGIADNDTPSTKLVEYTWKLDYPHTKLALKNCFVDGSIHGEDKATFRHFDDGWRLMWSEGKYLPVAP